MASTCVLVVVFVFDLIAFALAVAAEQRRATARIKENATSRYCVYESDISTGLGVGALLFLILSQLFIMLATHCMCCGRALSPGRSRSLAVFLFITCWVTFIIAEACLLAGSIKNAHHTNYRTVLSGKPPSCEMLRKGVFGTGAAFVVLTGIVSELYYVFYSKSDEGVIPTRDNGIRMGDFN